VVVDDGVDVGVAVVLAAVLAALVGRSGGAVALSLGASDLAPTTAVRDVAELLDVDVQHRAGVRVLVATDRLAGRSVDRGQPADPAPLQDRVDR